MNIELIKYIAFFTICLSCACHKDGTKDSITIPYDINIQVIYIREESFPSVKLSGPLLTSKKDLYTGAKTETVKLDKDQVLRGISVYSNTSNNDFVGKPKYRVLTALVGHESSQSNKIIMIITSQVVVQIEGMSDYMINSQDDTSIKLPCILPPGQYEYFMEIPGGRDQEGNDGDRVRIGQ